jgi:predicted ATPase
LNSAINSGGVDGLPDSAEAAAMARIDGLTPEDRALVRRAAVLGQTFHPRMLSWLDDGSDVAPPEPATWTRLRDLFSEGSDGYLRFRRSLLRDAAYEGLPYKLRRRLHGAVAARIAQDADDVDEVAGILSLHYLVAGDYQSAWRYATIAGKRAAGVVAYVEAAGFYTRALEAWRRLKDIDAHDVAAVHGALGDAWYQTAEFNKAAERIRPRANWWRAIRSQTPTCCSSARTSSEAACAREGAVLDQTGSRTGSRA